MNQRPKGSFVLQSLFVTPTFKNYLTALPGKEVYFDKNPDYQMLNLTDSMIRRSIFLLIAVLFYSCERSVTTDLTTIHTSGLNNSSSGIYKFKTLDQDILKVSLLDSIRKIPHLDIPEDEIRKMSQWIEDTVFSSTSADESTLDWSINDDDICSDYRIVWEPSSSKIKDTLWIRNCNGMSDKHLTTNGNWLYYYSNKNEKLSLHLEFFFDSIPPKRLKTVGYYELTKKEGIEEPKVSAIFKYATYTQIVARLEYLKKGFFREDIIKKSFVVVADSAYMYSMALDLWDRDEDLSGGSKHLGSYSTERIDSE